MKWARDDCKTWEYMYRREYNIPRVPIEYTENLTNYDFEYEFLLKDEFNRFLKASQKPETIDPNSGYSESEITMDPELYDNIRERAERGELIEFNLPDDSDAPRLSDRNKSKLSEPPDEFEPVDPEAVFGKLFGGD